MMYIVLFSTLCFLASIEAQEKKKVQCLQCESRNKDEGCKAGDFRVKESCFGNKCFAYLDTGRNGDKKIWKRGCTSSKNTCKGKERKGCILCEEDKCNKVALPDK
ncbi:uncharacterized protein LOC123682219 [Harmonia axyridis]|uniref:uncharacterized protein LOC123682219 n=1 Tax=Harmonia axyridis TaxID=115357 RepID=UPI001E278963|nr:uncharacterized protein LOC123682219 [Harmonia axyridis]